MTRQPRRGAAAALAAALAVLALPGCSDRMLDTGTFGYVLGGGPPPDEPSLIRPMTGENKEYPNLSTVPPRPTDIRPLAERQADVERLQRIREQNRGTARTVREDPRLPVQPMAVPPPAVVTPGQPGG
jgi:hypothetical protein